MLYQLFEFLRQNDSRPFEEASLSPSPRMSRQTRLLRAGALGPMRCWGLHRAASTAPPLTTQQKQFSALKRGNYAKASQRLLWWKEIKGKEVQPHKVE